MSQINEYELQNSKGAKVKVINLGARLTALIIPTKVHGDINTILNYSHAQQYYLDPMFHGAIAGPVCNRIANGEFTLNNKQYKLKSNEGSNVLHSGSTGLHQQFWNVLEYSENAITLQVEQTHCTDGFPGNVIFTLEYTLQNNNTLSINWSATSDQDTPANLTSHSYFNLAGFGDIKSHFLRITADNYTPHNDQQIPTGEISSVDNTIFDLRNFTALSDVLNSGDPEILRWDGLDHNWAYNNDKHLKLQAELYSEETQLLLQVESTLPGMQCYTGNQLGAFGIHGTHEGICLEPQYYPNSVNQENFPNTILKKNTTMSHRINLTFTEVEPEHIIHFERRKI